MVRSSNQLVSGNQLSSSLAPMKAIGTKKKLLKGKDYVLHMIFFSWSFTVGKILLHPLIQCLFKKQKKTRSESEYFRLGRDSNRELLGRMAVEP